MSHNLQRKVDALGEELAQADSTTRRQLLARLDRALVGQRPQPLQSTGPRRRVARSYDDDAESRFDNLPI